jgi:uncharacterized membrane protein YphA (DoxX/SURF4 family)
MRSIIVQRTLTKVCLLLRITYALLFIVVGIDKFFNIITQWQIYVHPDLMLLVPITAYQFLAFFGALQIMIGVIILSPWSLWGINGGLLMLIGIFINLVSMQGITVVLIHDLFMIIALIVLILLTTVQKELVV